jgi:hypothetical protein
MTNYTNGEDCKTPTDNNMKKDLWDTIYENVPKPFNDTTNLEPSKVKIPKILPKYRKSQKRLRTLTHFTKTLSHQKERATQ